MSDAETPRKDLLADALRILGSQYDGHGDFNDFFDGEEPISIASPQKDGGATYQYERSKVLFWLDRAAYEEERAAWENDTNEARHKDAKALIRANGLTAPFLDLIEAVERGRIVPFVGAGMSKPMGMPLWAEALRQLLERLPNANVSDIAAHIDAGRYLEAAQALVDYSGIHVTNFIRTTYRNNKMIPAGPMLLLPRIAKNCLITTNFDDAIERTYRTHDVQFEAYMHGTQEHSFFSRLVRGDRCLLKLHGDADDPASHILSAAQYEAGYGKPFDFHKPLPKALRQVFVSQSLLFLGCSLEQDWTLDLLEQARQANEFVIPNHYAILATPDTPAARQLKEERLLTLNIQPLWYPAGQHEYVERYLQLLAEVSEKRVVFNG